ncbi:MAG: sporulation protein YunB [Ruminococcus sp.]|nr:sporulation protein YunB [Ruminococcus sp.]
MRAKVSIGHKFTSLLLAAAIVSGVFAAQIYKQMVRHMSEICEYKGRQTATDAIGMAIDSCLAGEQGEYVEIVRGQDGRITMIDADPVKINKLENDLKKQINASLSRVSDNKMEVPIGTLTGITALSGRGPEVGIRLHQTGAVGIELKNSFVSTGLNQTRYSLMLSVTAELSAILPAHSTDINVSDEYVISETVIVGELPDTYVADPQYSDFI